MSSTTASRSHYSSNLHPSQSSRNGPPGNSSRSITPRATPAPVEAPKIATGQHAAVRNLRLKTAEGHNGPLKSVAWNSTGSRVASASTDRTVRVWYPERLPEPRSRTRSTSGYTWELKGHNGAIEQVSWDPTHSDRIASASADRSIKVWEYRMIKQLFTVELSSAVLHVQYSPDGKFLAVGTKDETISIISVTDQKVVREWQEKRTSIHQIVWSHSGHLLCLSTQQGTVKVFETLEWRFLHEIEGNTSSVFCLEFDPLGRYLAVGGADAIISLWDLRDWICVRTFNALTQPIRTLSFSFDGAYIASGSEDNFIDISDVETGEQVHTISVNSTTNAIAWHPNKLNLAIANEDKLLKLYQ
ncbi:Uncharacterized WD repeat-containing protein C18B5.10c [Taphrina deformans PYCC 5710]|uniref:Uncharacterized WD repeat-containing protein C18B5.10c n=1 Tax=Taphrina deformans (strain PYCC 5710 / ATCC 11124 / CBS 356.35 / IMI 108563 / JCM 9778 / NBRC 8474) TaxID=1097556 RepID=R4X6R4_TAPDE|nr:Uncharacterized WD repeat-containing protein C18B5.10c [Taphrina deformans PYCC 5710]|eukprot:CCG80887.1 Uncharacterized WD repeat-containing protein C18B5.10c [Taphrina deformans PYCC 5710]